MDIPLIAALEIGTSRTLLCVGEQQQKTRRIKVLGCGSSPTVGVRKGLIMDLDQAKAGVNTAIHLAEKESDSSIWQVILAVSGGHIQAESNIGVCQIRSPDHLVTAEDIDEVSEIAGDVTMEPDQQLLHAIDQSYTLDNQAGIVKPLGMHCSVLTLNKLIIHGLKNQIENVANVARNAQLDVGDVVFSGLCSSLAVLTPEQKENGVVLINLGGGTTSYVAYAGGVLAAAGCIAVGGDHVTNDIALAFGITLNLAEELKRNEGCAILESDTSAAKRVPIRSDFGGSNERMINVRALQTVIQARMDETFRVVLGRLNKLDLLPHLGAGVVLTGGGVYLRRVVELANRVFRMPCAIGLPINVDGLDSVEMPAAYTTLAGALIYGQMTYEDPGILSTLKRWFGRKGSSK